MWRARIATVFAPRVVQGIRDAAEGNDDPGDGGVAFELARPRGVRAPAGRTVLVSLFSSSTCRPYLCDGKGFAAGSP